VFKLRSNNTSSMKKKFKKNKERLTVNEMDEQLRKLKNNGWHIKINSDNNSVEAEEPTPAQVPDEKPPKKPETFFQWMKYKIFSQYK